jgi:hypothetical protein
MKCLWIAILLGGLLVKIADAQVLSDTTMTWRSYTREGSTHLTVYRNASDEMRPLTIVVREVAENRGPAVTDDARFLVEYIGRMLAVDPSEVTWVFHWGSFSYADARESNREILLRATFRRLPSGNLSTPNWKLLSRPEAESLTARRLK